MSLKNVYDAKAPTGNLVTTITGVIALIVPGLVLFGVLTQDVAADLQDYVISIVNAVAGIILIFKAKD